MRTDVAQPLLLYINTENLTERRIKSLDGQQDKEVKGKKKLRKKSWKGR